MFKRKSECQKIQGMLSPYIDGRLTSSERERMESHIEGCEACRWELESLEATVNLLHRVAMVWPPRSFALAEVAPKRRPAAFGTLRAATAVAVLLLAFLFLGDALHLFGAGLIGERFAQQATPMAGEALDMVGAPPEGEGYAWPLRQLELALLGVVVVLGGATAILWQRRRKGGEKTLKS
ncbi:MAG: anti-sigma factor family protein [Dehalococcoidia bacterium]